MKARRFRSRSILLGAGVATASLALVVLPSVGFSAWHTAISMSESIGTATVPTPGSASWNAVSTTTDTGSYPAYPGNDCPALNDTYIVNVHISGNDVTCAYANGFSFLTHVVYYCENGGTLSGTNCITTTTTPYLKFTWATPTAYDASGQDFVTGVAVVEGSSCSTSSWTVVAKESPSADSYTVDDPSTSEYYGLQTTGFGGWTSTVSGCTLG